MLYYIELGQRIRDVRKSKGLSQEQLAELINISTTHMSHIETGNTKLSLPVLVDIAAALNGSIDSLIHGDQSISPSTILSSISDILSNCSSNQSLIILDTISALQQSMAIHK